MCKILTHYRKYAIMSAIDCVDSEALFGGYTLTITDVSRALGVSKTTVSRAMSGTGRLSDETRSRVLKYIAKTGFRPNAAASNLATTKTRNIAYAMPLGQTALTSSYFLECLFGVSGAASDAQYDVIVIEDEPDELKRIISSRKVDGVILSSNRHGDDALAGLVGAGVPIVLTGSSNVPDIIQISYDARAAFRQITSKLIDAWDTKIALVLTLSGYAPNITRAEGYTDAFTARGIMSPTICWDANDEQAVCDILVEQYNDGVRGFICGDDTVCSIILTILSNRNYGKSNLEQIDAESIRLASFHNNRFLKSFHPEIPVVEMDPYELGRFAARMAIHKIDGDAVPRTTLLEYTLRM